MPDTRAPSKIANVLNALPKSAQSGSKAALAEIWNAENREHAERPAGMPVSGNFRSGPAA